MSGRLQDVYANLIMVILYSCRNSGTLINNIKPLSVWFVGGVKYYYAKAMLNLLIKKEVL